MSESSQQTIIVTGGAKGIGRAICVAFAGAGANVYFNYVSSESAARETEKRIADAGGTARGICSDVSSEEDMAAFFDTVVAETGRIDVLVNNAGIARDGLLVRMRRADWEQVIGVNLTGAFLCTRLAAKTMIRQRSGRIINITSIAGVAGNPGQASYSAAKAGIIGLTKTTARELAPRNITANAIAPGYIETDMTAGLPEMKKEEILAQIPLGRFGSPEDIAGFAVFLASEKAAYITGQIFHVNGGMYI